MPAVMTTRLPGELSGHRLLTVHQVMELMGISKTKFYAIQRSKDPFPVVDTEGRPRVTLQDYLWWVERHKKA